MNLPNKLTLIRIAIVPFFVLFMCVSDIPLRFVWALLLFVAASVTDLLDGKIARKYDLITNFGKFLDPLADKILVAAALVCFVEQGWTYSWIVIIILLREFTVSGIRLAAISGNQTAVIPANIWGKVKTVFTMIAIIAVLAMHILMTFGLLVDSNTFVVTDGGTLVELEGSFVSIPVQIITDILMYLTAAVTLISGVKYLYDYREYIDPKK
ncbi:MAG: CDP-diacylglycerol--glycerol-3-phosphate 3-phosphatidyltransferase [Oscillospiraceae bacterium]|nr:CDP-diacylglycerol--glycerol-3-phosphate 3-phosphatidyltransferase [Oscillospiraceae bacterium]